MHKHLIISVLLFMLSTSVVWGHVSPTTTVFVDVTGHRIVLALELPVDQLRLAAPQLWSTPEAPATDIPRDALLSYLHEHITLTTATETLKHAELLNMVFSDTNTQPHLLIDLVYLANPSAPVGNIDLHYTVILHRVVTHQVLVALRSDFNNAVFAHAPKMLGTIRFRQEHLSITRTEGSLWTGFSAMLHNGAQHIASGMDHLLFLFCLLLPAPFIVRQGRWHERRNNKACFVAIFQIVTAFTLGHSITLAIAALDVARLPSAPVEILVAITVLVAAMHAIRPLLPSRYTVLLAAGFGLIHGLAFANEMVAHGFTVDAIVLSLLGFNLGIEMMQLLIVAAVVPCLLLLSYSRGYALLRIGGAVLAGIAAVGWIAERAWGMNTPLADWTLYINTQWYWVYAALMFTSIASLLARYYHSLATRH